MRVLSSINRIIRAAFPICMYSLLSIPSAVSVEGWLNWRGPHQNGVSDETGLPDSWEPGGTNHLWTYPMQGKGTPVIAGERVYAFAYQGTGPDLQEFLVCVDSKTGKEIWKRGFNDFMSDVAYDRYSIGSPSVDAETGNVYMMTSPGLLFCFTADGDLIWHLSLMERYGCLTFPNGRTGSPALDGDLVIVNIVNSFWGAEGPARNRFLAFDKSNGDLVWSSTPGEAPKDSSFSTPLFAYEGNTRVFYAGTGCGYVVCINAHTGQPLWRYQFSQGGVNSSLVLHGDHLIAIHGKLNVDSTEEGRMIALKRGAKPKAGEAGPVELDKSYEVWRQELIMFTSSPVIVGDRIYQTVLQGDLVCIDANNGTILWKEKLATSQLHASPLYADGKLYVPMENGSFYIIRPTDEKPEILQKIEVGGNLIGSPIVWKGQMFLHAMNGLHSFGKMGGPAPKKVVALEAPAYDAKATALQIAPADVLIAPGEEKQFRYRVLDQFGAPMTDFKAANDLTFAKFVPPTARVRSEMDAEFNDKGVLVVKEDAKVSAGAYKATNADGLSGTTKGRILPQLSMTEDFESFTLAETNPATNVKFDYPPLPWIGARFKWEVRDLDGNKVLTKTLDNVLFQRAMTFTGHPDVKEYTIQADVMTDGDRRMKSNVGVINQRYIIALIGNSQTIEVSSNYNRIVQTAPYRFKEKEWQTIKASVDVAEDGSGVVRAKAWKKGEPEPDGWLIEVPHKIAHPEGVPGVFGFSPQSRYSVYIDNVVVTPNEN